MGAIRLPFPYTSWKIIKLLLYNSFVMNKHHNTYFVTINLTGPHIHALTFVLEVTQ